MIVKQKLSILFYHKKKKTRKADGKAPIYVRLTIDGLDDEISTGVYVHPDHWDNAEKLVMAGDNDHKKHNKTLRQMETDLERHYDLVQAKEEVATPALVFQAFKTPLRGEKIKQEKVTNLAFSELVDDTILQYIKLSKKHTKATDTSYPLPDEKIKLLNLETERMAEKIEAVSKEGKKLFENKGHEKTLLLAANEYLLNFMELACAGHRAYTSLEKMWGRKKRLIEFLQYNYQAIDLPLSNLQLKFMDQYKKYNMVQQGLESNTAMKYCQMVKEVIDRAVANGWIHANVFAIFQCTYTLPVREWPTWQQMNVFIDYEYDNETLELTRDAAVFMAFTGLAYQELYSLSPDDIITGIDGKEWINKDRQKTDGDETLPLLPIPKRILEKYRNHPKCVKKGRLFPMLTNQAFNRNLKVAAALAGLNPELEGHDLRYFFANEVTYNQGVPLKTTSRMLGHGTIKTTEIYVRVNRENISENMDMVERKLFDQHGTLKVTNARHRPLAKVVTLTAV